jgi:hypothetical protein
MSDRCSPNDARNAQSTGISGSRAMSEEEVARLWQRFRRGAVAPCPRDGAPLALAVDGSAKAYRLVCTQCGNASQWFEASLPESDGDCVTVRGDETERPPHDE